MRNSTAHLNQDNAGEKTSIYGESRDTECMAEHLLEAAKEEYHLAASAYLDVRSRTGVAAGIAVALVAMCLSGALSSFTSFIEDFWYRPLGNIYNFLAELWDGTGFLLFIFDYLALICPAIMIKSALDLIHLLVHQKVCFTRFVLGAQRSKL